MKNFIILLLLFITNISTAQLGVNLNMPERGGTYIDVVKENYRWVSIATGALVTTEEVDNQGWPLVDAIYIFDERPVAEWTGSIDDPEVYRLDLTGTYKCSFNGKADVLNTEDGNIENYQYDEVNNKSTFDLVVTGTAGLFVFEFSNTKRTATSVFNTGFTNFKMLRPGYDNDDDIFHQPLVDILTEVGFSAVRYMMFTGANGGDTNFPESISWENRKLPTDASQNRMSQIGKKGRSCWEYVIALANKTMTDPWINIPVSADSNYVIRLAELLQKNLDPTLNIYVESSNEVWNTAPGFEQTEYNRAQGVSLGLDERQNHGRRTVELSKLFAQVYGQDAINDNIRIVMSNHKPMLKWWVKPTLQYINTNFGPPSSYIYALSTQTYFTGGHSMLSVDELLDKCHENIVEQMDEQSGNEAGRLQWIQMGKDWNLTGGLLSYEGGPDHGGGSLSNINNKIKAERNERMCDIMKFNIDTSFLQVGGELGMHFMLSSPYMRYGSYGLTDDIDKPYRNFKMACVKDMLDNFTAVKENEINKSSNFEVYPNPILDKFSIDFNIKKSQNVSISVYNILGSKIMTLVDKRFGSGKHTESFQVTLDEGIYFVNLQIDGKEIANKKIIFLN
ncbi:MAG: T9SS type A sorting domain-containing protein [Saprospiraceae bacterium]